MEKESLKVMSNEEKIELRTQCIECKEIIKTEVNVGDYHDWVNGKYIQDAFPYLTASQRELLISGVCGECFTRMFGEGE